MTTYKPPQRLESDGPVVVRRLEDIVYADLEVEVTTFHHKQSIELSEFNAWRLYTMLGNVLNIPLHPDVASPLGEVEMVVSFPTRSLGDKVAQNLVVQKLREQGYDVQEVEEE